MSLKCIVFLYVIKYIIVNDCFVICVGSSLLSNQRMCHPYSQISGCDTVKGVRTQHPSTPSDYQTPQYIPNHEKICLTREEAEYVYQSVKNGTQVKPVHISRKVDKSIDVSEKILIKKL